MQGAVLRSVHITLDQAETVHNLSHNPVSLIRQ